RKHCSCEPTRSSSDRPSKKERTMAMRGSLAALMVLMVVALPTSTTEGESFYAGGLPVVVCPDLTFYDRESSMCRHSQTGALVPATVMEAWITAQSRVAASNVQTQSEKLQKQVDHLAVRVQALEAALSRSKPGPAPK